MPASWLATPPGAAVWACWKCGAYFGYVESDARGVVLRCPTCGKVNRVLVSVPTVVK